MSEIENFFKEFSEKLKEYEAKERERRKRGLHDYNIFTTFLGASDEVRLHSKFLHSLLDPDSGHCQDELFLSKFIEVVGIEDFGLDCKSAKVDREHNNIDIFITDESKHIIIENKIYAGDQDRQIERYIDSVKDEFGCQGDDIYVLYLSPFKRDLSEYSSGEYEFCDDNTALKKGDFKVSYKNITYDKEIAKWLEECEKEIANITDLSVFIKHYKNVVDQITNKNQNLQRDKMYVDDIAKNYILATQISENLTAARKKIIDEFMKRVKEILEKNEKFNDTWVIGLNEPKIGNSWNILLFVYKKELDEKNQDDYFLFTVEIETHELKNVCWGFRKTEQNIIDNCKKFDELKSYNGEKFNTTEWNIWWKWLNIDGRQLDMDLAKEIVQGLDPEKFAAEIIKIIKKYETFIDEINNNIEKYIKK
ncbi:MAG: PD-(D/E)XK nuclease family protein [Campylobacter sp.]|nr:PD-(D/E)XK nuclease family protein [Campylobacter sp.]